MELINSISGIIAAVIIPVVIALVGHAYTKAIREREIQGRLVELAIGILKEMPEEKNHEVRSWAVDVVDQFSGVRFPEGAKSALIKSLAMPMRLTPGEHRQKARNLKAEERFDEAVEAYLAAFDLEPNDPRPLNFAGVILSRDLKRYDEAEDMYNQALDVNKEYVSPIYNKACNEVRRDNYSIALDYLEEAISKDSKYQQMARRDKVFEAITENNERKRFERLTE